MNRRGTTAEAMEEGHATTWDLRLLKYYDPVAALNRLLDVKSAEDAAVLDLRTSYHALMEASQRHEMNLKARDHVGESLRLACPGYESGFGTFPEAATAEALLKSTEASALARARFEFVMEGGRIE